jgi:hypothetical protein
MKRVFRLVCNLLNICKYPFIKDPCKKCIVSPMCTVICQPKATSALKKSFAIESLMHIKEESITLFHKIFRVEIVEFILNVVIVSILIVWIITVLVIYAQVLLGFLNG